ncbi:hypothetical protein BZG36_02525 [Bifiguratus adelaidae]|uniref:Uncharacterized protein n=1 Tax=Bifiguratus adelaidae TaxID=1938954 RepID=A0A261Y2T7_9FUNG|nr:hypothetical protein BZG36_02525 [Bifiguratus adelaidae]
MAIPTLHWLSFIATVQSLLLLSQARPYPYWHFARDGGNQTAQSALLAQASQLASANSTSPNDALGKVLAMASNDFKSAWQSMAITPVALASSPAVSINSIPTVLSNAAATGSSVSSIPIASASAVASSSALPSLAIASDSQILAPLATPTPFLLRKRALSASSSQDLLSDADLAASSSASSSAQTAATIIPTWWPSVDDVSPTAASAAADSLTETESSAAAAITPAPLNDINSSHRRHDDNFDDLWSDDDTTPSAQTFTATLGGGPSADDFLQISNDLTF